MSHLGNKQHRHFSVPTSERVEPSGLRVHQHHVRKKMIHGGDKEGKVKKSEENQSTDLHKYCQADVIASR